MTSRKPTGPGARPLRGRALGLRRIWLATVAAVALAAPMAYAQQPVPSPEEPAPSGEPTEQPSAEQPFAEQPPPDEAVTTSPEARAQARRARRGFAIVPTVGLEAAVTDNVALTENNRKTDFLLRALIGIDAVLNRGRTTGELSVRTFYDQYARMNDFNGYSLELNGVAALALVPDVFSLEAHGTITNGRTINFGTPAIDRAGVTGRVQYSLWDVDGKLDGKLGGLADFGGIGRFSQIYYSAADKSHINTPLPPDDSLWQAAVRIDTAKRLRAYQLVTVAKYEADDHGYNTVGALQSVYVRLGPKVRLIARAGYEHTEQQGVTNIDAPVLSAGFEVTPNANSKISVEGGERYHRANWAAHAEASFADHIFLYGDYGEALQPDPVSVAKSFQEFVDESLSLPSPLTRTRFTVQDNIYTQTSFYKAGDLRLVLANPRTSLEFAAHYTDREFLTDQTHDRTASITASVVHALRPDLSGAVDLGYAHTYSSPVYGETRNYSAGAHLDYRVNSTTDLSGAYAFADSKQLFAGGQHLYDNTFLISLRKRL